METTPLADSRFILTTLGQYGNRLPIGRVLPDGSLSKEFTLKDWRMKQERQLAEWKSKYKGKMTLGLYVTQVLATMVDSIGGIVLPDVEVERRLLLAQMPMGDIMYMYVALRRAVLGNVLKMRLPCPGCNGARFEFQADLDSLDIRALPKASGLEWTYTLKQPLVFKGAPRSTLKLRPTPWASLENKNSQDAGSMSAAVIAGSIVGMDGIPDNEFTPIHESMLDELSKMDLELLNKSMNDNMPGPVMVVEEPCTKCGQTYLWPVDWGYDSFFSHSSL